MKYLIPFGGYVLEDFGVLTSPIKRGIYIGIKQGMPWAMDNDAFTHEINIPRFIEKLTELKPYKSTCLFVTCPDKVGDAKETLELFSEYRTYLIHWPIAFVAQDGQEDLMFPDINLWDTLFVGGTDKFKDGPGALKCVRRAMYLDKRIHIGRVNEWKRYSKFAQLEKEWNYEFTCDGTKTRFIGAARTIKRIRAFQERSQRQNSFLDPKCSFDGD